MKRKALKPVAALLLLVLLCSMTLSAFALTPPIGYRPKARVIKGQTCSRLLLNDGPGTRRYFNELGTYGYEGEWVRILAKAWDPNNGIWWIKVDYNGTVGWTGYKRFYASSFDLDDVPTETWY